MKNYKDQLSSLKLPVFILFKNLKFEHDFDLDSPVSRGEIVFSGKTYLPTRDRMPMPCMPDDEYKMSLLDSKYGHITENELTFDDSVFDITEGEPCDYEIFGESYTIAWFCPPDENAIINYLLDEYRKNNDLVAIWSQHIDRLHLYPFDSLEISSVDFYDKVNSRIETELKSLPQPPTAQEWMDLSDYM
jgi:hypothetical protein